MATFWKDNLKKRVPEYHQDSESMNDYLEVCGSIYDRIVDQIELHDIYSDYKYTPEGRLGLIAQSFGFDTDFDIDTKMFRYIVRDLNHLIRTKGIAPALDWCFKLVGWEVTLNTAWLPDPHRYDHKILEHYPDLFYGDPDNDTPSERTDGGSTSANEQFTNTNAYFNDDYFKVDYRNFLYGEATQRDTGVYFKGGPLFGTGDEYDNIRIVGEEYQKDGGVKDPLVVASTPYLVVNITNETLLNLSNVVDKTDIDGETNQYTFSEKYNLLRGLLDYLLYDFEKPTNVVIIAILSHTKGFDCVGMCDNFEGNRSWGNRADSEYYETSKIQDRSVMTMEKTLPMVGKDVLIGQPTIPYSDSLCSYIGMHTIGGINAFTRLHNYKRINEPNRHYNHYDLFTKDLKSRIIGHSHVPFSTQYEDGGFTGKNEKNSAGDYVGFGMFARTPSTLKVVTDTELRIEYKTHIKGEWKRDDKKFTPGTSRVELLDIVQVRFSCKKSDPNVHVYIDWEDQQNFKPSGTGFLAINWI